MSQTLHSGGEDWRPYQFRLTIEQELGRWAADGPLTKVKLLKDKILGWISPALLAEGR